MVPAANRKPRKRSRSFIREVPRLDPASGRRWRDAAHRTANIADSRSPGRPRRLPPKPRLGSLVAWFYVETEAGWRAKPRSKDRVSPAFRGEIRHLGTPLDASPAGSGASIS